MMNPAAYIRRIAVALTLALVCSSPSSLLAQTRTGSQAAPPVLDVPPEPDGLIAEPSAIERAVIFADRHFGDGNRKNGFYTDFFNMVPGAGWIAGGPGYRHWYAEDHVFVDASTAISWHGYKTAQARFELPRLLRSRLALGTQVRWQDFTQINFFGDGPGTVADQQSEYRLKSTNLVGYATFRPVQWVDVDAQIGWLSPLVSERGGTFKGDRPDTRDMFPNNIVYAVGDQPAFVHTEGSITADTRDFPGHPTRGRVLRASAANYSDRDAGVFSFRRYEAEAAQFLPLAGSRVVIALRGWLVASDTSDGQFVPFYLQPSLGGHNSLRGYADYRFHDGNLLLFNAEARVPLMKHVDLAGFFDAGNVASRIGDLDFDRQSYGAGLRLHSRRQTYARLDLARGDEGWRFIFRLTEPLNLTRLTRRTANVPFVP
jgi:outer membrane protein assembly factor BamA